MVLMANVSTIIFFEYGVVEANGYAKGETMKYLIKKPDTFLSMLNDDITSILHKSFDNLFPEYVFDQEMKGMVMPVDIKEYEDNYVVKVEMPGIGREDIKLDLHKNSLAITASKSMEKNEKMKHKYHKTEFRYGDYCRTLYFPNDINVDKCDATLKSGILTIDLEKVQREEEKHKQIEIKE